MTSDHTIPEKYVTTDITTVVVLVALTEYRDSCPMHLALSLASVLALVCIRYHA